MELRSVSTHLQNLCHDGYSHDKVMCRIGDVLLPIKKINLEKLSNEKSLITLEIEE